MLITRPDHPDIQAIVGDDSTFKQLAVEQVAAYNLDQLTTVTLPSATEPVRSRLLTMSQYLTCIVSQTILSRAAQLPGRSDAFVDPEAKLSFTYNHENGVCTVLSRLKCPVLTA